MQMNEILSMLSLSWIEFVLEITLYNIVISSPSYYNVGIQWNY